MWGVVALVVASRRYSSIGWSEVYNGRLGKCDTQEGEERHPPRHTFGKNIFVALFCSRLGSLLCRKSGAGLATKRGGGLLRRLSEYHLSTVRQLCKLLGKFFFWGGVGSSGLGGVNKAL